MWWGLWERALMNGLSTHIKRDLRVLLALLPCGGPVRRLDSRLAPKHQICRCIDLVLPNLQN